MATFPLLFVYGLPSIASSSTPIVHPGFLEAATAVTFPVFWVFLLYAITTTAKNTPHDRHDRHTSVSSTNRSGHASVSSVSGSPAMNGIAGPSLHTSDSRAGRTRTHIIGDDFDAAGSGGEDEPTNRHSAVIAPRGANASTATAAASDHAAAMIEMQRSQAAITSEGYTDCSINY
jgi:hypothetical protein